MNTIQSDVADQLAAMSDREARRNDNLDRWVTVSYAVKTHIDGVDDNYVRRRAGARRAHLHVRIPVWLCDFVEMVRGGFR